MSLPAIITWKPSLSVGIARIDADHKQLIKMINRLFGSVLSADPTQTLGIILGELTGYVVSHFELEEGYMRQYHYPDYDQHKADHQRLLEDATNFRKSLASGLATNLRESVEISLRDWLVNHIQGHDKHLGQFLRGQGML